LFATGCGAQATTAQSTSAQEEALAQSSQETVQATPLPEETAALTESPEAAQSEAAQSEATRSENTQAEAVESAALTADQTAAPEAVQTAAPAAAQTASPTPAQKTATATQAPAAAATATPAAPTQAPAQTQTATLETALRYVGCDVAQLYAAVGQPLSAEYASSCMGDGEDGVLTYDTFTVTTYREGGVETVQDAY
jgi:hypothetical protein